MKIELSQKLKYILYEIAVCLAIYGIPVIPIFFLKGKISDGWLSGITMTLYLGTVIIFASNKKLQKSAEDFKNNPKDNTAGYNE